MQSCIHTLAQSYRYMCWKKNNNNFVQESEHSDFTSNKKATKSFTEYIKKAP